MRVCVCVCVCVCVRARARASVRACVYICVKLWYINKCVLFDCMTTQLCNVIVSFRLFKKKNVHGFACNSFPFAFKMHRVILLTVILAHHLAKYLIFFSCLDDDMIFSLSVHTSQIHTLSHV